MKDVMVKYQIIGNCLTDLLSVDCRFPNVLTRLFACHVEFRLRFILFFGLSVFNI